MSCWEYRLERLGPLLTDFDIKKELVMRRLEDSRYGKAPGSDDEPVIEDLSAVDQMNLLGNDHWELVTIVPDSGFLVAFFKRPI